MLHGWARGHMLGDALAIRGRQRLPPPRPYSKRHGNRDVGATCSKGTVGVIAPSQGQ